MATPQDGSSLEEQGVVDKIRTIEVTDALILHKFFSI